MNNEKKQVGFKNLKKNKCLGSIYFFKLKFHETIIFFEYTGKQSKYKDAKDFYNNFKIKNYDYGQAEAFRDIVMYFKNNA